MPIYGETWNPDTLYQAGDYVYAPKRPGFLYVALNRGTSHSRTAGYTGMAEPNWVLEKEVLDGHVIWKSTPVVGNEQPWRKEFKYQVGNRVVPTSGPVLWGDTYYCFKAYRFIYEPDWPREANVRFTDNNITWQSQMSSAFFLPKSRLKETAFIELYKIIDYLSLQEELILNDVKHKFNDREKLSVTALNTIISEFGYDYIAEALNLTTQELRHLVAYIGLVHALKGSKTGLYLVMELMGISYRAEEWWEKEPKGEADTWSLFAEVDAAKATSNMVERLVNFTRNYVYPILDEFVITYKIDLAVLDIFMGGFVDQEYEFIIDTGWMVLSMLAGFVDQELGGAEWIYRPNMKFGIIVGGFVDQEYEIIMAPNERNLIAIETADRAIVRIDPQYKPVSVEYQVATSDTFSKDSIVQTDVVDYTEYLYNPAQFTVQDVATYIRVRVLEETQGWSDWSKTHIIYANKIFAFNVDDDLYTGFGGGQFIK